MSLIRYEPYSILGRFQNELNRLGGFDALNADGADDSSSSALSQWRPAVDIKEEEKQYSIIADLPGVDPKDIDITMEDGGLTIKGERGRNIMDEQNGYRRVERTHGSFYRRFSLPDTANAEKIEAKSKNGVLEIVLPKHEKVQPKRISVSS